MNVGLLWIPGSIWQMLRGSIVIFTAILSVTYRKKPLYSSGNSLAFFEFITTGWTGVAIVSLALVIVGGACFKTPAEVEPAPLSTSSSTSSSVSPTTTPMWEEGLGMLLVVLAQGLQALQTIVEEKLMHDVKAAPTLVVGMEGVVCSKVLYLFDKKVGILALLLHCHANCWRSARRRGRWYPREHS